MQLLDNMRKGRVVALAGIILLCACVLVVALYIMAYQHKLGTDENDMIGLIKRELPIGSSRSMVEDFLHSNAMKMYIRSHGYIETTDDSAQVQKVPRYAINTPGWQSYPGGSALQVSMNSNPYGTIMSLQFFFDARNLLFHYRVNASWAGI